MTPPGVEGLQGGGHLGGGVRVTGLESVTGDISRNLSWNLFLGFPTKISANRSVSKSVLPPKAPDFFWWGSRRDQIFGILVSFFLLFSCLFSLAGVFFTKTLAMLPRWMPPRTPRRLLGFRSWPIFPRCTRPPFWQCVFVWIHSTSGL